jgi:hypothetical protein
MPQEAPATRRTVVGAIDEGNNLHSLNKVSDDPYERWENSLGQRLSRSPQLRLMEAG